MMVILIMMTDDDVATDAADKVDDGAVIRSYPRVRAPRCTHPYYMHSSVHVYERFDVILDCGYPCSSIFLMRLHKLVYR